MEDQIPSKPYVGDGRGILHQFWELNAARSFGQEGLHPISYSEITAYSQAVGIRIPPKRVSILSAMDRAYRGAIAEQKAEQRRREEAQKEAERRARGR
ncbi:hypothetical protein [Pseudovibrio sp. SPO723]|uniref:phage tail assembly chaperone n=1 Tax=Nesiotobacter zosterae TaxID=392721 RepID=UPI0029C4E213|nr:hypothetical protein [Pseudovibrio sp. SPO723]MDX5592581.1 hypothetical protein [Pseudovibrio sp. SPO723]